MSLVQAIITNKFVIMSADTRGNGDNDYKIEGFNKMVRVNRQIVFGCTGGIKDNYLLFDGFCKYSDKNGLTPNEEECDISYNEFVAIITKRFRRMYELKHRKENPIPYEIMSVVAGFNGNTFEATTFNIDSSNGIDKAVQPINFPYKGVSAGKIEHLKKLEFLVEENYKKYGRISLGDYKNVLREVYKSGAEFDDTINNDIQLEVIKLKDVIK